METRQILVVDDEGQFRAEIRKCLSRAFTVIEAETLGSFHDLFRPYTFDLVILDMRLESGQEGLELLREIRAWDDLQPVIMVSAYGDSEAILDAAESGALMFLHKREFSPELLARMVDAVLRQGHIQRHLAALQARVEQGQPFELTSGISGSLREVERQVQRAADEPNLFVVATGEVGSGHELVAQAIHDRSRRRGDGPLLMAGADRGSINKDRGELLFGAGAPSRSPRTRGLLEQANHGVLFLGGFDGLGDTVRDNLGECLHRRSLSEGVAGQMVPLDVQIVAGLEADRAERVVEWARTRFGTRNVVEIQLPPLRDRAADIALLVPFFLRSMRSMGRRPVKNVSRVVQDVLESYPWPGNLAELRSVVEFSAIQACLAGAEDIRLAHLPAQFGGQPADQFGPANYRERLARTELALVDAALTQGKTNPRDEIAKQLGYNDRVALGRRMRRALSEFPTFKSDYRQVAHLYGGTKAD